MGGFLGEKEFLSQPVENAVNTWLCMKEKKKLIYRETFRTLKNTVIYIFGHTAQH